MGGGLIYVIISIIITNSILIMHNCVVKGNNINPSSSSSYVFGDEDHTIHIGHDDRGILVTVPHVQRRLSFRSIGITIFGKLFWRPFANKKKQQACSQNAHRICSKVHANDNDVYFQCWIVNYCKCLYIQGLLPWCDEYSKIINNRIEDIIWKLLFKISTVDT